MALVGDIGRKSISALFLLVFDEFPFKTHFRVLLRIGLTITEDYHERGSGLSF
jgi:hypothetical protein